MTQLSVSVIIVSRERPAALIRCLKGLALQTYPEFEVVVVADPAGIAAVGKGRFAQQVKQVTFVEANISKARNLGIAQAAGEIVAFVDDDAVPEPTWLTHLTAPFSSAPEVVAAGGFVRGRNGISFQWKSRSVDGTGATQDLAVDETRPTVLHPVDGRAIKTEGTNMALRRDVLAAMGGFDPAFHYYLDETDLNMRLAAEGHATAIVPLAEVHHGFLANRTRHAGRAPRDLFEIGASLAVYLRKHCPAERISAVWSGFQKAQRQRALRYMVAGDLEPRDVRRLLHGLRAGYEKGLTRPVASLPEITRATEGFLRFPATSPGRAVVLAGRSWRARVIRDRAKRQAAKGERVSVFLFSPTGIYHRVQFHEDGYWEQRGGLFGRSERQQPLFRLTSFGRRLQAERKRVADQRGLVGT